MSASPSSAAEAKSRPWFWWLIPFWGLIELFRGTKPSRGSSLMLWAWIAALAVTAGVMACVVYLVHGILEGALG